MRNHARLAALLQPCEELLLERAQLKKGMAVVDVGCGMGSLTAAAASVCGPEKVCGVDISEPMLGAARAAHPALRLLDADAQTWTPSEPVDRVLSRFGVMFFPDPAAAFANMRGWLGDGGRGRFVALVWRAMAHNPWIRDAVEVFERHVSTPSYAPGGPGPWSLADRDALAALLHESGFGAVEIEAQSLTLRVQGDAEAALNYYCEWSPSARFFEAADAEQSAALRRDFEALVAGSHDGAGLDLGSSVWVVSASA